MSLLSSIYTSYPRNNPCPCESNKKAKNCCLKTNTWNKFPSDITPKNALDGIENVKCYAKQTKNCCEKISGEHYISKNVLEIVNDNKGRIPIEGVTWIPVGESRVLPTKNLVSNILCKRHNEALSPLDAEAGKLIKTIGSYDNDFNATIPKDEIKVLCGEDIERWMLKTTCGLVKGGHLGKDGIPLKAEVKDIWIDILYGKISWPNSWGLYVSTSTETIHHSKLFGFLPMTHPTTHELIAVDMLINNFKFYLLLGNPDNPAAVGIHRPRTLIFKQNNVQKYIELSWQDKSLDKFILFERKGTYDGKPPNIS